MNLADYLAGYDMPMTAQKRSRFATWPTWYKYRHVSKEMHAVDQLRQAIIIKLKEG